MSTADRVPRRTFVQSCVLAAATAVAGEGAIGAAQRLAAQTGLGIGSVGRSDPETPEVPTELRALMQQLFAGRPIQRGHVTLDMPAAAEDSRVVPVLLESDLPMTAEQYIKSVHLIVDYNPHPYVAGFDLTPEMGPFAISTRIKLRRTGWVRAIAETNDGSLWGDYARVRITIDGCA